MKRDKDLKIIERSKKWNKRICITEEQYKFIKRIQQDNKYKTMAGTLDMIINKYKKL